MDDFATHLRLLAAAVAATEGPVVECGAGEYSTLWLHAVCHGKRYVRTLETDAAWLTRFGTMGSPERHELIHVADWAKAVADGLLDPPAGSPLWAVAFVDSAPPQSRAPLLEYIRTRAEICVLHDVECGTYALDPLLKLFPHRLDDRRHPGPWTAAVSMTNDLADVQARSDWGGLDGQGVVRVR